jgi:uncharacterized membrane protein
MLDERPRHPIERIHQNVETIASLHARAEDEVSAHQRGVESVTAAVGRPASIYAIALVVLGWMTINLLLPRLGRSALDPPPFPLLQGAVGLSALFVTIIVLTTQNRQSKHAEQRAQLDLQVNLLAEQKVAKVIALVEELRRDMPAVPDRVDRVAEVMTTPLDPNAVMTALVETFDPRANADSAKPEKGPR